LKGFFLLKDIQKGERECGYLSEKSVISLKMEDFSFEEFFYYVFVFVLCLCYQTK